MNMPRRRKYESEDEYINRVSHTLYNDGYNIIEIAKKLKIDINEVYNILCKNNPRVVTEKERQIMIDLYNNDYTINEIAEITNRYATTVRNRIKYSAECPTRFKSSLSDDEIAYIKNAYLNGVSLCAIGRKLNLCHGSVKYRLVKMGLYNNYSEYEKYHHKVTKKDESKFRSLWEKGLSISKIAKTTGFARSTVSKYLHAMK